MGLFFRKRIKILRGLYLNVGNRGPSISVGRRGASVNVGKNGTYFNAGAGGVRYRQRVSGSNDEAFPEQAPEGNVLQYSGCAIYFIGFLVWMVCLFCGVGMTGFYIFLGSIFLGSMAFIAGKPSKDSGGV